jgi:hypothetical protein
LPRPSGRAKWLVAHADARHTTKHETTRAPRAIASTWSLARAGARRLVPCIPRRAVYHRVVTADSG